MVRIPLIALTGRRGSFCRRIPETYFFDSAHHLEKAGGLGVLVPITTNAERIAHYVSQFDGLLLQGGDDVHPIRYGEDITSKAVVVDEDRDAFEIAMVHAFLAANKPIFGICRGLQIINVALGGSLIQELTTDVIHMMDFHTQMPCCIAHRIEVVSDTMLSKILEKNEIRVNSFHKQAIKVPAPHVRISAIAPDGTPEAIELSDRTNVLAVQWHPEWLEDESSDALFQYFVAQC